MNKLNLPKMSTVKPPKPKKTPINDEILPNILDRCFDAEYPNQKWISDITYIWAENRWYYLCVVMDLFARKIIAYKISSKIDGELVRNTIKAAYRSRGCPQNVIFHMDRGSQYTADETRKLFDEYNTVASYSKKGCPFDNAVVEAFFKFLKRNEVYRRHYATKEQMYASLFEYISGYYNTRKKHSACGFLSPNKKELLYWSQLNFSNNKNSCPEIQTAVGGTPNSCLY
ncbi:MAG: IS3 family transposase [Firmicutes bacterium]|nr:IS3 family transposase [Bacillota bacterium]